MTIPHDAESAFRWALENSGTAIWFIAILAGLFGFGRSKRRQQQRLAARAMMPGPPPVTMAPPAAPPVSPAASGYNPPPPSRTIQPRAVAPVAAGTPVTAAARVARSGLLGAFADPAHARTAVVLSELLAPPVALR